MLLAACLGFLGANSGMFAPELLDLRNVSWPWVSQIGMVLFFSLIGFELRNEFAGGLFQNPRAILVPALAAAVGVVVPALVYLSIAAAAGSDAQIISGWPMVTATDVSFALMAYSLLARGLPRELRAFLLSFAVIDDILATVALAIGFWRFDALTPLLSTTFAISIAFALRTKVVTQVIRWLSPLVAFAVLPTFAFFAVQIRFDPAALYGSAGPLMVLLFATRPISKWVGVFTGALLGNRVVAPNARLPLTAADFLPVASLAGIGFTVSLLAADLAFGANSALFALSATLTILASIVAALFATIALRVRLISK